MPNFHHYALVAVIAYLMGSLNFSLIVSTLLLRKDVRKYGSGSAGATNTLRVLGKGWAAAVSVGDFAKGAGAVLMGRAIIWGLEQFGFAIDENAGYWGMTVAAFAVILGHAFPIFFRFRGGKSVLSTAGVLAVLDWRTFLCCGFIFFVVVLLTRYVSVGSLAAAISMPVGLSILGMPMQHIIIGAGLCVIVVVLHHENIDRLIRGVENKLGGKKKV